MEQYECLTFFEISEAWKFLSATKIRFLNPVNVFVVKSTLIRIFPLPDRIFYASNVVIVIFSFLLHFLGKFSNLLQSRPTNENISGYVDRCSKYSPKVKVLELCVKLPPVAVLRSFICFYPLTGNILKLLFLRFFSELR